MTMQKKSRTTYRYRAKRKKIRKRTMKSGIAARRAAATTNNRAQWAAYKDLQTKIDQAWGKLRAHIKHKVNPYILMRDKNHLMLLLGECNYMTRECIRCSSHKNRRT